MDPSFRSDQRKSSRAPRRIRVHVVALLFLVFHQLLSLSVFRLRWNRTIGSDYLTESRSNEQQQNQQAPCGGRLTAECIYALQKRNNITRLTSYAKLQKDISEVAIMGPAEPSVLGGLAAMFPSSTVYTGNWHQQCVDTWKRDGKTCFEYSNIQPLFLEHGKSTQQRQLKDDQLFSVVVHIVTQQDNDDTIISMWELFSPQMMPQSVYVVQGGASTKFLQHVYHRYPDTKVESIPTEEEDDRLLILYPTATSFRTKVDQATPFTKWCWSTYPGFDLEPFYDKHGIKGWLNTAAPGVRFAQEYGFVDKAQDVTRKFLEKLPNSYILKSSHVHNSRTVVKVINGTVECLSKCHPQGEFESHHEYIQRICRVYLETKGGGDKPTVFDKVKPRCIFEEMLPLAGSQGFRDFKVHVFHGKPMFVYVSSDKYGKRRTNSRSISNWTELPFLMSAGQHFPRQALGERPEFMDRMAEDSVALYEAVNQTIPVSYIRVDFFEFNSSYVFAELKFHHEGCLTYCDDPLADKFYGYVVTNPNANIPGSTILDLL